MAFVKVDKDVITYSAAISAFEKGRRWQLALELFRKMALVKIKKDVVAYGSVSSACEKGINGSWPWGFCQR